MNRTPVQSSNVRSVGYENGVLEVEFASGVYRYKNVPPILYGLVTGAESVGKFLNAQIKPFFEAERVTVS